MFTPILVGGVYQFTKEAYAKIEEKNGENTLSRLIIVLRSCGNAA
jgi:hypothetical protein